MIQIILNGVPFKTEKQINICQLLKNLNLENKKLAVEVNKEIISSNRHDTKILQDNDKVEIVHAIGGG